MPFILSFTFLMGNYWIFISRALLYTDKGICQTGLLRLLFCYTSTLLGLIYPPMHVRGAKWEEFRMEFGNWQEVGVLPPTRLTTWEEFVILLDQVYTAETGEKCMSIYSLQCTLNKYEETLAGRTSWVRKYGITQRCV